jgi:hypothetical protein
MDVANTALACCVRCVKLSIYMFIRVCEPGISVNVRDLCNLFTSTNASDAGLFFDMRMLQEGVYVLKQTKLRVLPVCTCACVREHLRNCTDFEKM